MKYETLEIEIKKSVAVLKVNRPEKLNALSELVLTELQNFLTDLRDQKNFEIRGLILTGAGEKAFIAGADIKAMSEMTPDQGEEFGKLGQRVTELFESLKIPVIACVNGYALGGGCEMAMSCDFIYAVETASFGQPEVNLGLIPGFGGCVRLLRYVGSARAKELIYTGRSIRSDEAKQLGLVNQIFTTKEAMINAALDTLTVIQSKSPIAVGICKNIINLADGATISAGLEIEKRGFRKAFESVEMREGTSAFLEKRKANF